MKDGQRWRYEPPDRHTVAWLAVDKGGLRSHAPVGAGELAVFEESGGAIELEADGDTILLPEHSNTRIRQAIANIFPWSVIS